MRTPSFLPAAIIALLALFAACGGTPTPTAPRGPTLDEIIARAEEASAAVASYRYTGVSTSQSVDDLQNVEESGAWTASGGLHMRMKGVYDGEEHINEVIFTGGRIFVLDSHGGTGEWMVQAQRGEPHKSGGELPFDIENATLMRDEVIDGVPVFHLHGERQAEPGPTPEPGQGSVVDNRIIMDLYISKDTYRAMRSVNRHEQPFVHAELVDGVPQYTTTDQHGTSSRNYYDFNGPITVQPPEAFR